jgi:predicted small secreted protein
MSLALALVGCNATPPVANTLADTATATVVPSTATSEQAAATQTKANTAEEKAVAYLNAQGKTGYTAQSRVVYADHVVITLVKTGTTETTSVSVDAKTGTVTPATK